MGRLSGKVAVVTGASRGAGRGIALSLGVEEATVYVTARSTSSSRTVAATSAIEDVAGEVSARGGVGVALRCDHTDDEDTRGLFGRVRSEHGGLDVLVANAWGGYMPYEEELGWFARPFWEQSMDRWDGMFNAGLRSQLATCLFGLPLMLERRRGLVVLTTFTRGRHYLGHVFYDVAKNAVCRLASALAHELEETDVAVVALSPGWMLCERMSTLTTEERAQTESVEYVGRAVAALAADPGVSRWSGQALAPATSLATTGSPMWTAGSRPPT